MALSGSVAGHPSQSELLLPTQRTTVPSTGGTETAPPKKTAQQLNREIAEVLGSRSIRTKYKHAEAIVDGRVVRSSIPNRSSIAAALDNYEILPTVREVPFSAFTQLSPLSYYSVSEGKRTRALAAQILHSGEINPLIVVEDAEGPYILEGGHRFDALRELGARAFPALVVLDLVSLGNSA